MFLVVVAVLSIILAFGDAPLAVVTDPRWVVAAVAAATLFPAALASGVAWRARALFEHYPNEPRRGQNWMADVGDWIHYALGAAHAAVLCFTDWLGLCGRAPIIADWPAVPGLLACVPFLLSIALVWTALYPAERASRQIALELSLFRGLPVRPVWSLREYVAFNFRHHVLFILIPMAVILLVRDVLAATVRAPAIRDPLLGAAAVVVAVLTPLVLRHVWITRPLAPGALRDRLERLARTLRMRCRDILVWETDGMIVNAAVVGVVPPLRYVLLSDALLERMDETRIEAVFGHESGHVKLHHITYILLFALISGCLLTVFSQKTRGVEPATFHWMLAAAGAALLVKWGVLFTWISWQFERQADVFGARALTLAGLPCTADCSVHGAYHRIPGPPDTGAAGPVPAGVVPPALAMTMLPPSRDGSEADSQPIEPVCRTAASVFADTLHDVARLNGVSPDAGSWRHPSISARSRSLQRLAIDPKAAARFERRVRRTKATILLGAVGSAAWAVFELRLWSVAADWLTR